jgi:tartrate-resistant acid phosphatase type 5
MRFLKIFYLFLGALVFQSSSVHIESLKSISILKKKSITIDSTKAFLNFIVIGDWGKKGGPQTNVSNAMAEQAKNEPIDFIVSVGDNFYPHGVKSLKDPQWKETFENVYNSESLNVPWYSAFGNHDYMGKIKPQLEYNNLNSRWKSTERYYSFDRTFQNSEEKATFIIIDTNPFDPSLNRFGHSDLWRQNKKKQLEWLENTLKNCSSSDWIIVIGHHPLYTTGYRRYMMEGVKDTFSQLFEQYKVDAYFSGHDHDLQHQKPEGHTNYFISGAGSDKRNVTRDSTMTKFAASDYGFMDVQLSKDTMKIEVINSQNKRLYTTKILK